MEHRLLLLHSTDFTFNLIPLHSRFFSLSLSVFIARFNSTTFSLESNFKKKTENFFSSHLRSRACWEFIKDEHYVIARSTHTHGETLLINNRGENGGDSISWPYPNAVAHADSDEDTPRRFVKKRVKE